MNQFVNIGHNNMIASSRVIAVVSPDSSPVKRLITDAKEEGRVIDTTQGKKTRSVIIIDTGHVILSGLLTETVAERLNGNDVSGNDVSETESDETDFGEFEED